MNKTVVGCAAALAIFMAGTVAGDLARSAIAQEYQSGATAALVVKIDANDVVYIDWTIVALTAKGRGPAAEQPILVTASKIMLAVRNGTWKPMPK